MKKITIRDFFYKKNRKVVIIVIFSFALIFGIFINMEIYGITKKEIATKRNYYKNIIDAKMKNLDYFIETLKNNTELKIFLDNDMVILPNSSPIEKGDGEYYIKYTKKKINRYIFSEKIKKTVKWDDAMEFEIYTLDKKLVFSTENFEMGFINFDNVKTATPFGNIYEYYIYDSKLYMRIFSKLNDDYLMIVNYVINSDFLYDLSKNDLKVGYVDEKYKPIIFTKDVEFEKIKILFEPLKNIKFIKYDNNIFITYEERIKDFNNKKIGSLIIFDKADAIIRLIFVDIICLFGTIIFVMLMFRIMSRNYDFTISFIDNVTKIMNGEAISAARTNILEYDEITEKVAEYRKLKEEKERYILKEIERKNDEINIMLRRTETQNRFLKKISEKDDIRTILEISYSEFEKITVITELIFSMSTEEENSAKVLKISKMGLVEEEYGYDIKNVSSVSKLKKEEIIEIDGNGEGLMIIFFASETIKNGFISINYEVNEEKKTDIKEQLIKMTKLMITSIKSAKYYEMSIKDSLTGAYVKGILKHNVDNMINTSKRYKKNFSILMADIDFFKKVNDEYGHLAGDQVLKKIGEIIRAAIRESDMFFRYGGEEFIILMPETGRESAEIVAERIRRNVEDSLFYCDRYDEKPIKITLSLGGYDFELEDDKLDYFDIIEFVDKALYKAKKGGRNKVVF